MTGPATSEPRAGEAPAGDTGDPLLGLTPPRRDSPVSDIARQLLGQLLSGRLAPGTRLPSERQFAERLGVGRSAVREALKALDVLGILDVRTGDGTYIKRHASDLLPQAVEWGVMLGGAGTRDLVEARLHIESLTSRLAAERATEAQVAALGERLAAMQDAATTAEFVEADIGFHLVVADAAGNAVLAGVLSSIRSLLRVWITRALDEEGGTGETYAEHRRVHDAIAAHDGDAAAAAMAAHLTSASGKLARSLDRYAP